MKERTQRRLAAIVSADIVGYSRLMGLDETGTLADLHAHRSELIDPLIDEHGGRIVKTTGDGLLLEFPSVVAAVECAIATQQGIAERNRGVADEKVIRYRIGVHVGDIIIEGDDIFGDGVNIAARIEPLAAPDGISLSDDAYRQVRDRLDIKWEDAGEHEAKNIARPLQVWRWTNELHQSPSDPVSFEHIDQPSIAVLPFDNMSGDTEQEYFADGIAEDIITDLSKLSGMFVIARNSTFIYKGRQINVQQIATELGVKFVLEGSVRKAGNRVRINAQLINGGSGGHVWAERYDRELDDIFAIQDEITGNIVQALKVELDVGEKERMGQQLSTNVEAYDYALRGRDYLHRMTPEANAQAQELYEKSLALDPKLSAAHAEYAIVLYVAYTSGWNNSTEETLNKGVCHAHRAIELTPDSALAHRSMAYGYLWSGDLDNAVVEIEEAFRLGPSTADVLASHGYILSYANRPEEAISSIEQAIRLSPEHPPIWLHFLGHAHFVDGNYGLAVMPLERRIRREPRTDISRVLLAACYGHLGRCDEARKEWEKVLEINPTYSMELKGQVIKYKDPSVWDRLKEGLRLAGVDG